jgi:hypothetical protein
LLSETLSKNEYTYKMKNGQVGTLSGLLENLEYVI